MLCSSQCILCSSQCKLCRSHILWRPKDPPLLFFCVTELKIRNVFRWFALDSCLRQHWCEIPYFFNTPWAPPLPTSSPPLSTSRRGEKTDSKTTHYFYYNDAIVSRVCVPLNDCGAGTSHILHFNCSKPHSISVPSDVVG